MERRRLGQLEVSAIGLGCATMTPFYGQPDPESGDTEDALDHVFAPGAAVGARSPANHLARLMI